MDSVSSAAYAAERAARERLNAQYPNAREGGLLDIVAPLVRTVYPMQPSKREMQDAAYKARIEALRGAPARTEFDPRMTEATAARIDGLSDNYLQQRFSPHRRK